MKQQTSSSARVVVSIAIGTILLALLAFVKPAGALEPIPPPDPQPGSYGIEATKTQDPPTTAARISTPGNGASFDTSPISVSGICDTGLLVQVYNNGVMAGSVMCESGSFQIEVSLFAGTNELSVTQYDDLGQAGPESSVVTVEYTDTNMTAFGELITLTSSYGRRSAQAGNQLTWPLQLSGGTGPYAFSIDWGDGSPVELKSQSLEGVVNINHVYKRAGIYQVSIRVTDVNDVSAYLQLVAVSSGEVDEAALTAQEEEPAVQKEILWTPAVAALVMMIPTYWLGRRSQLVSLHNKMLKEREAYSKDNQ